MADKEFETSEEVVEAVEETEEVTETAKATEKKSEKKAKKEEKKPGFFARMGASIKKFWKTMKSELKKVTWYSRKQTFNSTLLVIVCMVVFGAVIGVLDWGFSKGLEGLAGLF